MASQNSIMSDLTLDLSGRLIDNRYYLYQLIASNSRSQVFLARDFIAHRKCIIKRLDLSFCSPQSEQTLKSLFEQEALILKRLAGKPTQVCQFYRYFRADDFLYLVQEWIAGISLEKRLRQQQKLSESETRHILVNLLSVLDYVHRQGIVHRDIKPKNIAIRDRDRLPVLIDFGIATIEDETLYCSNQHASQCDRSYDRQLLKVVAGTPGYMSVQQAMGQTAYSNDLYSLGLTAIHLLTGQSPLSLSLELPKTSISRSLNQVLQRAISALPERRYTSAAQMRAALLPPPIQLPNCDRSRLKPKLLLASLLVIQLSGICLLWQFLFNRLDEQPPLQHDNLLTQESLVASDDEIAAQSIVRDVIFTVGTSEREILQALGEPVWRQPGFWNNSVAWSYENVISEGIDLGYMFDLHTDRLQQAEITVPPATEIGTLRFALTSLLGSQTTIDLERELVAVHQRHKTAHNFAMGDLRGVIQRNDYDRIYLAVWSAGFHL